MTLICPMRPLKDNFRCFVNAYQSMLTDQPSDRQLDIASKSAVGMTEMQGENAISLSIVMKKSVSPSVIQAEKEQSIKRSDVLEFVHARETINELGGFAQLKDGEKTPLRPKQPNSD